jgi:hypothetical protein
MNSVSLWLGPLVVQKGLLYFSKGSRGSLSFARALGGVDFVESAQIRSNYYVQEFSTIVYVSFVNFWFGGVCY